MRYLPIFVPEYVNVDTIDKCFQDKRASFEHVDSATFDAAAQQAVYKRFLFLEKEHFLVYFEQGEPFKCHYQSRNWIMPFIRKGYSKGEFIFFKEVNGLRMTEQKPIHYFVCSVGSGSLHLDNRTEENTIVEYFDSEDVVDLAKFAEIVKSKPNCVQKHFIVCEGTEYCAVETDNVENTYIFSSRLKYRFVPKLAAGTATIDMFIEKDKLLGDRATKLDGQSGFKLCDTNGEIIPDGKEFAIQILRDSEDKLDEEYEEETEGLSEEELLFRNKDWIDIHSNYGDSNNYILCGRENYAESFECETIDDIVYLKNNGRYLFFDVDNERSDIFFSYDVPTKEECIHIHYDDNGDICLTKWDGSTYVTCEWIKCAYGAIYLCEYGIPQRFRLVTL